LEAKVLTLPLPYDGRSVGLLVLQPTPPCTYPAAFPSMAPQFTAENTPGVQQKREGARGDIQGDGGPRES
jgi:hypothetical protein